MERITKYQLASMIILFQIGSSPLFLLASESKHNAWTSVLIAMLCGLALLAFVTLSIQKQEPDKNLIEIIHLYFGKVIGHFFSFAYVIYFIYKSVRNVREFGDLTILYLLPQTPISVITLITMLISAYAIYKGLEVFSRVTEVLLPVVMTIYLGLFTLLICTGLTRLDRLLPLLDEGIKPVVANALPEVISFPFGEMVLFLMYWKHLDDKKRMTMVTLTCYSMVGLFLTITNALIISVLGPLAGIGGIPLMQATSMIQIAKIVERMDPFVALLLFTGVLIKQTAYFFGAALALSTIFKISYRFTLIPAGAAIYIGALMFRSHMQQIYFGFENNLKQHFPIFQIVFPIFLLLLMKIRGKKLTKET